MVLLNSVASYKNFLVEATTTLLLREIYLRRTPPPSLVFNIVAKRQLNQVSVKKKLILCLLKLVIKTQNCFYFKGILEDWATELDGNIGVNFYEEIKQLALTFNLEVRFI